VPIFIINLYLYMSIVAVNYLNINIPTIHRNTVETSHSLV